MDDVSGYSTYVSYISTARHVAKKQHPLQVLYDCKTIRYFVFWTRRRENTEPVGYNRRYFQHTHLLHSNSGYGKERRISIGS